MAKATDNLLSTPVEIAAHLARSPIWVRKFIATHNVPTCGHNVPARATKPNSVRRYRMADILAALAREAAVNPPKLQIPQPRGPKASQLDAAAIATTYLGSSTTVKDMAAQLGVAESTIYIVLRYGLHSHYGFGKEHVTKLLDHHRYIATRRTAELDLCARCQISRDHAAVPKGTKKHCGWCVAELSGHKTIPDPVFSTASPTAGAVVLWR